MSAPSPPSASLSTVLTASCLCGRHTFNSTVPTSKLPLDSIHCHCDSCRHLTGAFYSSDIPWHGPPHEILEATPPLARYQCTPKVQLLFCAKCGTPMFFVSELPAATGADDAKDGGKPKVCIELLTGALANHPARPVPLRIATHNWVGDASDGGAAVWLRQPNGQCDADEEHDSIREAGRAPVDSPETTQPEVWSGRAHKSEKLSDPASNLWREVMRISVQNQTYPPAEGYEDVRISCKCGGVDLKLLQDAQRRNYDPETVGDDQLPWFVDPATRKCHTILCACDSCRVAGGTELFPWTWVDLKHITRAIGTTFHGVPGTAEEWRKAMERNMEDALSNTGTLRVFESSPGVRRCFCSRCSAAVFYHAENDPAAPEGITTGPGVVRLAVGLLELGGGARAERSIGSVIGKPILGRRDAMSGWRRGLIRGVEKDMKSFLSEVEERAAAEPGLKWDGQSLD